MISRDQAQSLLERQHAELLAFPLIEGKDADAFAETTHLSVRHYIAKRKAQEGKICEVIEPQESEVYEEAAAMFMRAMVRQHRGVGRVEPGPVVVHSCAAYGHGERRFAIVVIRHRLN